jgi:hypothetical protein
MNPRDIQNERDFIVRMMVVDETPGIFAID